jgi:hypothetical protein
LDDAMLRTPGRPGYAMIVAGAVVAVEAPALAPRFSPPTTASACFAPPRAGDLSLDLPDGSATVAVVPSRELAQTTSLILGRVDRSQAPPMPDSDFGDIA